MTVRLILPLLLLLGFCAAAQAQLCVNPVASWNGTVTTKSSSTTCTDVWPDSICSQSDSINASMPVPQLSSVSYCTGLEWAGRSDNVQATVNDRKTTPCLPPTPGNDVDTIDTPSEVEATIELYVDAVDGIYQFFPNAEGQALDTETYCGGSKQVIPSYYPFYPDIPSSQPLPSVNVTPLYLGYAVTQEGINFSDDVVYNVSVSTDPDYLCRTCMSPSHSSIDTANQILAEDVPIVGTGFRLHYDSSHSAAAGGASVIQADTVTLGGWSLNVHHVYDVGGKTLYLGDGTQRNAWTLGTPALTSGGHDLLTSADGSEIYEFDAVLGRHLRTLLPLTGSVQYQFGYDSAGRLLSVTDEAGNVTSITRDGSGHPTAIVSPYGQKTLFQLDTNGFLASVTDPAGNAESFTNSAAGLITSRKDWNGNSFTYSYDSFGHLTQDADSLGGKLAFDRAAAKLTNRLGRTVTQTTASGITASYALSVAIPWILTPTSTVDENLAITGPDGLTAASDATLLSGQLQQSIAYPDGTSEFITYTPDPRWGIQAPISAQENFTSGSLTQSMHHVLSVTLAQAADPTQVAAQTDTFSINGRTYTTAYTGSQRSVKITSPAGRVTSVALDPLQRVTSFQNGTLAAQTFSYDSQGRLASAAQGNVRVAMTYDSHGNLASTVDRLGRKNAFNYDAANRMTAQTFPDARLIQYKHDANGNVVSVELPGGQTHKFTYDADDHLTSYAPPSVSGAVSTTYAYDADERLTSTTRPDDKKTSLSYDTAGRVSLLTTPTTVLTHTYDVSTGQLRSVSQSDGTKVTYGYNGMLPTTWTVAGAVSGSVSRTFDDNFWIRSQSVGTGTTIDYQNDQDGLITGAGAMTISRDANGMAIGSALGEATDTSSYDSLGQLSGYTAFANAAAVYDVRYKRDLAGRIAAKTETIGGATSNFSYQYDKAGRLVAVFVNGVPRSTYQYDGNSNRSVGTTPLSTAGGSYDSQDRLLSYGSASFSYTANGELQTQTVASAVTSYEYDTFENLLAVTLPNGTTISYLVDPEGHRIGRKVNGILQAAYLYDGDRIVAQLDGASKIVSQFIYATDDATPDYMIRGGVTYRFFSDSFGSPRVIVNTSNGEIVERVDYDEFGNVLADTQPGWQPFGFAGGLYDGQTGLLRFGERDYFPGVGRWTTKDPSLFAGGDSNLYGYVFSDPINLRDPDGLGCRDKIEKVKKKAKEKAKELTPKKISTPLGDVSLENPKITIHKSIDVEVVGQKVGSVDGEATVGITTNPSPSGPLFYVDLNAGIRLFGKTLWEKKVHEEGGDLSKTQVSHDLDPAQRGGSATECLRHLDDECGGAAGR